MGDDTTFASAAGAIGDNINSPQTGRNPVKQPSFRRKFTLIKEEDEALEQSFQSIAKKKTKRPDDFKQSNY